MVNNMDRYKCWDCEKEIHFVQIDEETKKKLLKDNKGFMYLICRNCQDNEDY